jgi:hypothetical protein
MGSTSQWCLSLSFCLGACVRACLRCVRKRAPIYVRVGGSVGVLCGYRFVSARYLWRSGSTLTRLDVRVRGEFEFHIFVSLAALPRLL